MEGTNGERRYICDTSVIVDGRILDVIADGRVRGKLIVPLASLAELEHQANMNKEIGFAGFAVLRRLKEIAPHYGIAISFEGKRPTGAMIKYAKKGGEIDALIRKMAAEANAVLITGDKVQRDAAEIEGIGTIYLRAVEIAKELAFKRYFTDRNTMSVHFKEDCIPVVKTGKPGKVILKEMGEKISLDEIRRMSDEIIEATKRNRNYYFEIDREGATVIQMDDYRIVITKPPFSDGFEITIVRPIVKRKLSDYAISKKLFERLDGWAEGIIICGPPGCGKSTFAAALAEYYESKHKVVKTMESPRDLQVKAEITQYAQLDGSFENTKEVLLLVRPDYTIYDEMRKNVDFQVYADMRMTGIGLVGVVHGRRAIDAVQRFIGKVELGMIPQIVDTVVLIDAGEISKVYELEQVVKVPAGMREEDLSRPVIVIRDFESGVPEYEIYKFGEETVVMPLRKWKGPIGGGLEDALRHIIDKEYRVEKREGKNILYTSMKDIKYLLGRGRKKLERLEKVFGPIEVREL